MKLDLCFPVTGTKPVTSDHAYHLYAAVSGVLPVVHGNPDIGVCPIRGEQVGNRKMALTARSELRIRTPEEHVSELLSIAGKKLIIGGEAVRVGVPRLETLKPATALYSRLVTIKLREQPVTQEGFSEGVRRQLDKLNVSRQVNLTVGNQHTVCVKRKEIIGFKVLLESLTAEESVTIQEQGIGGRRSLGCGLFLPVTFQGEY